MGRNGGDLFNFYGIPMSLVKTLLKEGVPCDRSCLLTEGWPLAAELSYIVEVEIEVASLLVFWCGYLQF